MLTPEARDTGWKPLFDGKTTAGWRGYRSKTMPAGWQVIDGALTRVNSAGDIITNDKYRNFELALEWKVAEGGNSGIFYRVGEDSDYPWRTGLEMQVLDDARHPDGRSPMMPAASSVPGQSWRTNSMGTWADGAASPWRRRIALIASGSRSK
jgi:3-keto-disaccharide hydrolase